MEILRLILLYGHLIGFALVIGGAVTQYILTPLRINSVMLWGSLLVLLTGIGLSAPIRDEDLQPSPAKLVVKLLLALAIAVMVWAPRKRAQVAKGHFLAIIGLTLVNAGVAVFW